MTDTPPKTSAIIRPLEIDGMVSTEGGWLQKPEEANQKGEADEIEYIFSLFSSYEASKQVPSSVLFAYGQELVEKFRSKSEQIKKLESNLGIAREALRKGTFFGKGLGISDEIIVKGIEETYSRISFNK